jgi:hypothetical protein
MNRAISGTRSTKARKPARSAWTPDRSGKICRTRTAPSRVEIRKTRPAAASYFAPLMVTAPVRPSRVTHSQLTCCPSSLDAVSKNRFGLLDKSRPEELIVPRPKEGDPFPLDGPHQVRAKSFQTMRTTSPFQVT